MSTKTWQASPLFSITMDLDWASEDCIEYLLARILSYGLKPTVFITHYSPVLEAAFSKGVIDRAIHPNFLPNSTHGRTSTEVVEHVLKLVPEARGSRSHAYAGSSMITETLQKFGMCYDSSPLFLFQQDLMPMQHSTGIWHLPVFWEDDAHWCSGLSWDFSLFEKAFFMPGLKIIDLHPFFYTLNIPNADFYLRHKIHIPSLTHREAKDLRYTGEGCALFVDALLKAVATSRCYRTLDQIMDIIVSDNAGEQSAPF